MKIKSYENQIIELILNNNFKVTDASYVDEEKRTEAQITIAEDGCFISFDIQVDPYVSEKGCEEGVNHPADGDVIDFTFELKEVNIAFREDENSCDYASLMTFTPFFREFIEDNIDVNNQWDLCFKKTPKLPEMSEKKGERNKGLHPLFQDILKQYGL